MTICGLAFFVRTLKKLWCAEIAVFYSAEFWLFLYYKNWSKSKIRANKGRNAAISRILIDVEILGIYSFYKFKDKGNE